MDEKILELKNQLHKVSMEIEREIDKSECDEKVKNLVYSTTKPYEHVLTHVLDYLDSIS